MKQIILVIIISYLFVSCASIMNFKKTTVNIYTTGPAKIIVGNDTLSTKRNKASVLVNRNSEPVNIIVTSDSIKKKVQVNSFNSFGYYANIICNLGIGMLIDKNNPKRYGYPKHVYINASDTNNSYKTYPQATKGRLDLHLSFPYINWFYLQPQNEGIKSNMGFAGASVGLDYYTGQNQFLNIAVAVSADAIAPVGPVHRSGPYENMGSLHISLTNNHWLKRFMLGYGLCLAKNNWYFIDSVNLNTNLLPGISVGKASINAGLILPLRYLTGKNFFVGIIYRPTLFRLNKPVSFSYEHIISFDFGWKIKLKK